MSTIPLVSRFDGPTRNSVEDLSKFCDLPEQNYKIIPSLTFTKSDVFLNYASGTISQIDDNICLVEYFSHNKELLNIRPFTRRSGLLVLAEVIIGNGLINHSKYIVVLRNRKSGNATPKSDDRQLMRYLLSGFNILGTTLLDYIINGKEEIFSAKGAGML